MKLEGQHHTDGTFAKRALVELVAADNRRATRRNRRILVPQYGGPDVMTVIDEPLPEPRRPSPPSKESR
jgi:hypothetical protein